MRKYIGLRNIVTNEAEWKYLLNYEIDGEENVFKVLELYNRLRISFVCYQTKHGFHFVGLTPISAYEWGYYFQKLQNIAPEYYNGQTIRLSLKQEENQELIKINLEHPYIERLANVYIKRFGVPNSNIPVFPESEDRKFVCVFEKYWSEKN